MAEKTVTVESSRERIALELAKSIADREELYSDQANYRKTMLDLYAECLNATSGYRKF